MAHTTPRPELLALLAAVKDEPDDDTPKFALADWLQEQDDEADRARGEYLRALVCYDRVGKYDPIPPALDASIRLVRQYESAWFGRLTAVGFRHCDNFAFSAWGLPFPSIDGTKLVTKAARAVAGTEEYAWVAGLVFFRISAAQLERFADSPLLAPLVGLTLEDCNITESSIAAVVNSPHSASLKRLVVELVAAPPVAIANSPFVGRLRELRLWRTGLADDGFKALCESPHLNQLRSLAVGNNALTIHAARAFA